MRRKVLGFILAALFVSTPVWANYVGEFLKAGIDVSSNIITFASGKSIKLTSGFIDLNEMTDPSNPAANRGRLYVNDVAGTTSLMFRDSAGTETNLLTAGSGGTLDQAYDQGGAGAGRAITVDSGAVALTNNAANNLGLLTITKNPVGAQSGDGLVVTMGAQASGSGISFANTGSGNDLTGSGSTWSISKAGVATFTGLGALTSGMTVSGGVTNLNANSNFATNINTGTSTGTVTLGGGTNSVVVNSSTWDVSAAGAFTGVPSIDLTTSLTLANGGVVRGSAVSAETWALQVYDNDTGPGYKNAILFTNGNTPSIVIGDNNPTVAINSADWDISATGDMTGIGAITADGLFTGSLGATITGAAVNLNASSNFAVNIATGTSVGTVTIGGAAAQQIDIGNGAAAKTVALGSSNTTSTTTLLSGSGGLLLNNSNNQPTTINGGTSSGTLTLGGASATVTGVGTWTINNDAAALTTGIGTGTTTGAVTIGGAGAQTLNIGNGAAAKTVNLGSSNTTSTTTILSGSGGVLINKDNSQPVEIGDGTSTGAITIGGAAAQTLNIGNGAAAKTVNVGSTNTTSTTTIASGSGGIILNGPTKFAADTELTLDNNVAGAITVTQNFHNVDTNADAATGDLATINGGADGMILILKPNNAGRTVVVKHAVGNIQCGADVTMDNANDTITLIYDGSNWLKLSSADNGA